MQHAVIGFDADDTLWQNEVVYTRAKAKFQEALQHYSNSEQIVARLDEIEISNISYYGYGIKSFALSMIEAAVAVTGGKIAGSEIIDLVHIVKEMLATDVEIIQYVEDTLARLAMQYPLMLITKGDTFEQERKIARSGLAEYFRYIEIVADKSEDTYRRLLEKYNIRPDNFLMVGNSLKSDILPVVRIGGKAVYIPNDQTWSHETPDEGQIELADYAELSHLGFLPGYVAQLFASGAS